MENFEELMEKFLDKVLSAAEFEKVVESIIDERTHGFDDEFIEYVLDHDDTMSSDLLLDTFEELYVDELEEPYRDQVDECKIYENRMVNHGLEVE